MLVGISEVISVCKTGDLMLKVTLKAAIGGELTGLQDLQSLTSMFCHCSLIYSRMGVMDTGCCEM